MKQPQIFKFFASTFMQCMLIGTSIGQIPDSLKFDWHLSGLDTNYIEPSGILDITSFGATPNDNLDDFPALQAAFASAAPNGGVILFPPGRFHFNSSVFMPSNFIVRGAGSDSTIFEFNLNNTQTNSFNFSGNGATPFHSIIDTINKGGSRVELDSVAVLSYESGDRIEIRQFNGAWNTNPASWAEYSIGHISTIDSISGNSLFLTNPLRFTIDTTLAPQIRAINVVENSGLECVKLIRNDSLAIGVNCGVFMNLAFNCRIRGVEGYKGIGAHVLIERSAHLEVSGCYFHEAYGYTGSNTRGYGVVLGVHANLCLIENNIFRKLRHSMMVKQGANGNVFAYNYSIEPNRSEFPSNYGADICIHGHYPFANLFEGNICQNIIIDQAWGPNGPQNAYFRNRAELYGFLISNGTVQSDRQTIVGNDITSTAFFQGQYSLNGIGHYQQANRVQGNVTPAGSNSLTEVSLFRTQPPVYWGNQPWPGIGLPFTANVNVIPASQRYINSVSKTICGDPDTLFSSTVDDFNYSSQTQPSIHQGVLYLKLSEVSQLQLIDVAGRIVCKRQVTPVDAASGISLEALRQTGIYLLSVSDSEGVRGYRLFVPQW